MNNPTDSMLTIPEIEQIVRNWEAQTSANLNDVFSRNQCNDGDINSAVTVVAILGASLVEHVRAHLMLKSKAPGGGTAWN